jgi:hypothetical protein
MTVNTDAYTGVSAGNPQPQTTLEPAGGPFIRHTREGRRLLYTATPSFGGIVTNPQPSSPGYLRQFRVRFTGTTAAGTGGVLSTGAGGVDAPFSIVQLMQAKDSFGVTLFAGPGYEMLKLVPMASGQFGTDETTDVQNMPSWKGITAATGAFDFCTDLPLEFAKAYGLISGANAALLPYMQFNLNTAGNIFSTSPSALPTLTFQTESDFYWLPQNVDAVPPGLGTTCQWIYQQATPVIPSAASVIVQLPKLGGYITVLILELRDSTGARIDAWPTRPRIIIDGVTILESDLVTLFDDMAIQSQIGGGTSGTQSTAATPQTPRPTGVMVISFKTALAQRSFGFFETGEEFLSTNPGTQIEIAGSPWGTVTNTPAVLNVIAGQVVPSGPLVQGLPEV